MLDVCWASHLLDFFRVHPKYPHPAHTDYPALYYGKNLLYFLKRFQIKRLKLSDQEVRIEGTS